MLNLSDGKDVLKNPFPNEPVFYEEPDGTDIPDRRISGKIDSGFRHYGAIPRGFHRKGLIFPLYDVFYAAQYKSGTKNSRSAAVDGDGDVEEDASFHEEGLFMVLLRDGAQAALMKNKLSGRRMLLHVKSDASMRRANTRAS